MSAAAVIAHYYAHRPGIRRRLAALTGAGLRAQTFDRDSGGTGTVLFCWTHGDEVSSCHRLGRCARHAGECDCRTRLPCQGSTVPTVTDRTGDAATGGDPWRRMLAECDRAELDLSRACGPGRPASPSEVLERVAVDAPSVAGRCARVFERAIRATAAPQPAGKGEAHDGRPFCESCARLRDGHWFSEPDYNGGRPTDLAGALRRKMRLCRTCMRFAAGQAKDGRARLPTLDELGHFRRVGKWPKQKEKVK